MNSSQMTRTHVLAFDLTSIYNSFDGFTNLLCAIRIFQYTHNIQKQMSQRARQKHYLIKGQVTGSYQRVHSKRRNALQNDD